MDREADSEASTKEEELSGERAKKRAGSAKRSKTRELTIHEEVPIPPTQPLPCGSRFKGYRDFVVQDLKIATHHTRYADHADFAGSLAAHPAERAYTFLSNGKVIDLDALVAGLELG